MIIRNRLPRALLHGFTLVELMVVILIGSILLAIVVPTYQAQIRKSRRTDARNAVLDLAAREERYFSIYNLYSQLPSDLGYAAPAATGTTWASVGAIGNGYYTLNVTKIDPVPATNTPASYTITATAVAGQLKDLPCRSFVVTNTGQQTATDSTGAAATTCWN
ncbi:MAG TPA: type IV pilin protein [Steroidobacteraceae bacterium]|nr:type IV pilin protein [Steroidobacteraceae bacterium]